MAEPLRDGPPAARRLVKPSIDVAPYPGLALRTVVAALPAALAALPSPDWLRALLDPDAAAPVRVEPWLRPAVRDLLRQRGYRPTGRGKPSSEYLAAAAADGRLGSINAVVDVGNAASLHSGLPISVVDLDRLVPPLGVAVPAAGASYVFNRSGQTIDVEGLLSLCDAEGPCANAVKDAQRTKTDGGTTRVLVLVWGVARDGDAHVERTAAWLGELLRRLGAECDGG